MVWPKGRRRADCDASDFITRLSRVLAWTLARSRLKTSKYRQEIAEALRDCGYGVTEFGGYGREGPVEIVNSVVHRNDLDEVMRIVDKWDKDAFVTVEDPKILRGGSFATREWKIVSPFGRPGSVGGGTRQRV